MRQIYLLGQRRFVSIFLTQFLGAFNDNLYKNALVIFITFEVASDPAGRALLVTASAGLFILPFFIFSAWAGQIADRLEKSRLIRGVKLAEIGIMLLGAAAFALRSVPMLIAVLFLMGSQSAFFGPLKYGILPQLLYKRELVAGNGLIQMATFVAILVGMIFGGTLVAARAGGELVVGLTVVAVALLGWLLSRKIPTVSAADPDLKIDRGPWRPMRQSIAYAREDRRVFLAILGVSWFWFVGATFLQLLPAYGRDTLHGDANVVILLLSCFTVGIGVGSVLCARLSGAELSLRLVPAGAVGLSIFAAVPLVFSPDVAVDAPTLEGVSRILASSGNQAVVASFVGLAVSGGIFIVPLYTYVQAKSPLARRARVIAANNIFNALLMVVSAVLTMAALAAGMSIPVIFAVVAVLNLVFMLTVVRSLMGLVAAEPAGQDRHDSET
jgi:MFS family permease